MHRTRNFLSLLAALGLVSGATLAHAGSVTAGSATAGGSATTATTATPAGTAATATATPATSAAATAHASDEAALARSAQEVDAAAGKGALTVANRLAPEFGMTADALIAQRAELGASWGQLMIAHALAANAEGGLTVEQLLARHKEGEGWGRIATDLNLEMGAVVRGVADERKVALGLAKADGRVAAMRGAAVKADAGMRTNAGLGVGHAATKGVGAGVNAGAGVGVGLGKGVKAGK